MNRAQVAAEVGGRLVTQLADAGMTADDSAGNLREPIDDALRALGYAEDDLADAEPANARGFIAMVRYHTLRAVWERIGDRFNVSTGGDSFSLNQAFGNVERLLGQAEKEVIAIYDSLNPGGAGGMVTLNTNRLGWGEACR